MVNSPMGPQDDPPYSPLGSKSKTALWVGITLAVVLGIAVLWTIIN